MTDVKENPRVAGRVKPFLRPVASRATRAKSGVAARSRKHAAGIAELVSEIPWMRALSPLVRDRAEADLYEMNYSKGDSVARVGEPSSSWIYVAEGLLKVSASDGAGRMIMYTGVSQGGWVGEGSVIKRELRRYDIHALRDTRLLHLPSSTFRWLLDTSLEFNHFIISQLNERLSQYISMVEIDRLEEPVARVAKSLAVLFNPVLYPNMTASIPLLQSELGELVGLHRQSINMALKRLQKEGHIAIGYGGVLVNNVNLLRNYGSHPNSRVPAGGPGNP